MITEKDYDNFVRERLKEALASHATNINAIAGGDLTLQRKLNGQIREGRRITPYTILYVAMCCPASSLGWIMGEGEEENFRRAGAPAPTDAGTTA